MDTDDNGLMEVDISEMNAEDYVCQELTKRLKESEKSYKVFDFSHVIITGSVVDIMDTFLRSVIDSMFRRTKLHCKTEQETEMYRQRLCKLYLAYVNKGLAIVDCLEPKLAKILIVKEEAHSENLNDRLATLRIKVAERTKRLQSLLALQSRLKTDTVLAEWVISKAEPVVYEAEKNLSNMECVSPKDVLSILNSLNRMKNSFDSLEIN